MKYRILGSVSAVMLAVALSTPASAGWGSSGGYVGGSSGYGSSGYTASYGSSGYAAAYGSSGGYSSGYGSSGYARVGLLQRWHAHKVAKHAYRRAQRAAYGSSGYSSYGSSGYTSYGSSGYSRSYGSSGGYSYRSTYGSSGGSSGYSSYSSTGGGSSGGAVSYGSTGYSSTSSMYYGASKTSTSSPVALAAAPQVFEESAQLTVAVPSDAKVFVNGNETTSTGSVRRFVSRGLEPGKQYKFAVRAELQAADGSLLEEQKEVVITAGQFEQLQFAFEGKSSPIATQVTLNVPDGAEVTLAGSSTKASGQTRTFRTTQLSPGQVWDDYEIEVKYGDLIKKQSIRLIAGDKLQLSFSFDDETTDRLAAR